MIDWNHGRKGTQRRNRTSRSLAATGSGRVGRIRAREIQARRTGVYVMSDEERAAVRRGVAQADRGEFVSDEVVAEADKRHGL